MEKIYPNQFDHYYEAKSELIEWKYIKLVQSAHGKKLNKLFIRSLTDQPMIISILAHCHVRSDGVKPLVYFSPTKEAIIMYDGEKYHLYGGASIEGKANKFHTESVNLEVWNDQSPIRFQPLKNESDGWAMEYRLNIQPKGITYVYDWELSNQEICEIEKLHNHYEKVLAVKKVH